ncbi:MAG TPA: hypothetical protein VFF27_16970 [Bacteroidia bacterium]|nr:hypothetical protein [Bacteroidia bacterium]
MELSSIELNSFDVVVDGNTMGSLTDGTFVFSPQLAVKYYTILYYKKGLKKKVTVRLNDEEYSCISFLVLKSKKVE